MEMIVTGATGFIGRNVCEHFSIKGWNVTATGRNKDVGRTIQSDNIEFRKADILDKKELDDVFSKTDVVVHCAAKTADWGPYQLFYDVNVKGTENVIWACKRHSVKNVVYISTPSVYYSGKDRYDIKEEDLLPKKQFKYGKTKLMAERLLLDNAKNGLRTIILRPRAVYGKYDKTILPRILNLAEGGKVPLINGGEAKVDITYIGNLLKAIEMSVKAPNKHWNDIYNISNGDPITLREWFTTVLRTFERPYETKNVPTGLAMTVGSINELLSKLPFGNKKPQMTRFSVGYMARSMTMCIDKAQTRLGWVPEFSNQEGFEAVKKWYDGE